MQERWPTLSTHLYCSPTLLGGHSEKANTNWPPPPLCICISYHLSWCRFTISAGVVRSSPALAARPSRHWWLNLGRLSQQRNKQIFSIEQLPDKHVAAVNGLAIAQICGPRSKQQEPCHQRMCNDGGCPAPDNLRGPLFFFRVRYMKAHSACIRLTYSKLAAVQAAAIHKSGTGPNPAKLLHIWSRLRMSTLCARQHYDHSEHA